MTCILICNLYEKCSKYHNFNRTNLFWSFSQTRNVELSRFGWQRFLVEITEVSVIHGSSGSQSGGWVTGEELLQQTEGLLLTRPLHESAQLVARIGRETVLEITR